MVIDLKDWFFAVPLHPQHKKCFAFSLSSINHQDPIFYFQCCCLPQEMTNSPTVCQVCGCSYFVSLSGLSIYLFYSLNGWNTTVTLIFIHFAPSIEKIKCSLKCILGLAILLGLRQRKKQGSRLLQSSQIPFQYRIPCDMWLDIINSSFFII